MHLGIFTKIFVRPTLEGALDAVAAHGLRWMQFNFACAGLPNLPDEEIAPALLSNLRQQLDARGLSMAAVSGTFNMAHPDPQQRGEGLRRLPFLAAACRELEVPVITLCTGTRDPQDMWRHHPENSSPEAWRDLTETLSEALTVAAQFGVTLAFEPEVSNVVDSARQGRRLLDEMQSPHLKVVMDAANLFASGKLPRMREVLNEAFQLLGADIVLAHAKDLPCACCISRASVERSCPTASRNRRWISPCGSSARSWRVWKGAQFGRADSARSPCVEVKDLRFS